MLDDNDKFYNEIENVLSEVNLKTIIRQPAYIIVAVMIVAIAILRVTAPEVVPIVIVTMGAMLFGFTLFLAKKH